MITEIIVTFIGMVGIQCGLAYVFFRYLLEHHND